MYYIRGQRTSRDHPARIHFRWVHGGHHDRCLHLQAIGEGKDLHKQYRSINNHFSQLAKPESFLRGILAIAAVCLYTPVLFGDNVWIVFAAFIVFEICVGIFWPTMGIMRGFFTFFLGSLTKEIRCNREIVQCNPWDEGIRTKGLEQEHCVLPNPPRQCISRTPAIN